MTKEDTKIESRDLNLWYGDAQALKDVTIAVKPEVILFDEPCSALDPISTARIEDLIGELKREYAIVTVTHNMRAGCESIWLHIVLPARRDDRVREDEADL